MHERKQKCLELTIVFRRKQLGIKDEFVLLIYTHRNFVMLIFKTNYTSYGYSFTNYRYIFYTVVKIVLELKFGLLSVVLRRSELQVMDKLKLMWKCRCLFF